MVSHVICFAFCEGKGTTFKSPSMIELQRRYMCSFVELKEERDEEEVGGRGGEEGVIFNLN